MSHSLALSHPTLTSRTTIEESKKLTKETQPLEASQERRRRSKKKGQGRDQDQYPIRMRGPMRLRMKLSKGKLKEERPGMIILRVMKATEVMIMVAIDTDALILREVTKEEGEGDKGYLIQVFLNHLRHAKSLNSIKMASDLIVTK